MDFSLRERLVMGEAWQDEWEGDAGDWEAAWAEWVTELGGYAKRFETREWLAAYLQGLLGGVERRNCWQLAEARGEPSLWIPALTGPCSMGCGRGAGCGAGSGDPCAGGCGRRLDRR